MTLLHYTEGCAVRIPPRMIFLLSASLRAIIVWTEHSERMILTVTFRNCLNEAQVPTCHSSVL